MNRSWRAHGFLVVCGRAVLVVTKSILIVLMLHLLSWHFHWRLFHEAGGSSVSPAAASASAKARV